MILFKFMKSGLCAALILMAVLNATGQHKVKHIQKIIDKATSDKLVGVAVYVKSPKLGEWTVVSGYSNLEKKIPLQKDDVFGLASIGKMFTATAIFKLIEEGKLGLDDHISLYLPSEIISNVPNSREVTIRHLLGHTSGFVNYEMDSELNRLYFEGQLKLDTVSHMDVLRKYFYGKPSLNQPGEKYHYSSTNYLLLTMIADTVLKGSHVEYFRAMLDKYKLNQTRYKETPPNLINHYGDLNQDGISENLTAQTIETTNWFSGDDGFYSSIAETATFLEMLMKGEILSKESLEAMMTWDNEKDPAYGLGLEVDKRAPYQLITGHSGSGVGMRTDIYYSPKHDLIIGVFSNSGLRAASPRFAKIYYKMREKIILKLFL